MSDETTNVEESHTTAEPAGPGASDGRSEWQAVIDRVDDLGDAIGRWAKAAVNDPDNRRRVEELREHLDRIGENIGESVKNATESDTSQQMKDAASKAGDALKEMGHKFGEEVLPKMAAAFEVAADKLADAADRMETKVAEDGGEPAGSDAGAADEEAAE